MHDIFSLENVLLLVVRVLGISSVVGRTYLCMPPSLYSGNNTFAPTEAVNRKFLLDI